MRTLSFVLALLSTLPGSYGCCTHWSKLRAQMDNRESLLMQIPPCGASWGCEEVPFTEAIAYCEAVQSRHSENELGNPVDVLPLDSLYARMHYFLAGAFEGSSTKYRDSWGYQYYSLEHATFRWDQVFGLALVGPEGGRQQLYESAIATDSQLVDISDSQIFDETSEPGAHCVVVPDTYGWKLMRSADLYDNNITTYCGVDFAPKGYFQVGTEFDVYIMNNRWFEGTPIVWFIDRETGEVSAQLYYQSSGKGQSQNYIWDMSYKIYSNMEAKEMFRNNPRHFFNINAQLFEEKCHGKAEQQIFPDTYCCGPPDNCTPEQCT